MEKVKKYIGMTTVFILILSAGVLLGGYLENSKLEKINGSLHNTQKIAVVNLDEGVVYQKKQTNYAKELISNYSENYVMTGLADAQTGIDDGRYAAYVIIPSDFSTNFVSINHEPKKSLLKYEISGNLSQTATDTAWKNVMQLKESMNDDVGYVYVSSILGEFHNAQDNAIKVLSNDSKDKEVLMAISNLDLVATLDLKEVERLENNIEDLDINPDIETNKQIISAIDTAYKGYLSETASHLTSLKDESNQVNSDILNISNNALAIENVFKDDDSANYSLDKTSVQMSTYKTLLGNNIDAINGLISKAESASSNNTQTLKNNVSTYLDTSNTEIINYHNLILNNQKTKITEIYQQTLSPKTNVLDSYNNLSEFVDKIEKEKEDFISAKNRIDEKIKKGCQSYTGVAADGPSISLKDHLIVTYANEEEMKSDVLTVAEFMNDKDTKTFEDYLNRFVDEYKPSPLSDVIEPPQSYKTDLQKALTEDLKTNIENSTQKIAAIDLDDKIKDNLASQKDSILKAFNSFTAFNASGIKDGVNDLNNFKESISFDDINRSVKDDLTSLNDKQVSQKNSMITTINNHQILSDKFIGDLALYDPLSKINAKEIESYVNDYDSNNTKTKYKIENKNREYVTFVSDSYTNANEQVHSMKDDVLKYQKLSDEMLTKGLENAKKVRDETSGSNNALMTSLINKLPYTRNGTVDNHRVYDFVMTSSDLEGNKTTNTIAESSFDYSLLFISLSIAGVIVFSGIAIFVKLKSTNSSIKNEQEVIS